MAPAAPNRLGGEVLFSRRGGHGTVVTVRVPLGAAPAGARPGASAAGGTT